MKRRELFSSLASSLKKEKKQEKILRPPYFFKDYENQENDESIFFTNCTSCDEVCSTVCEENIIVIQKLFTPKLDLK